MEPEIEMLRTCSILIRVTSLTSLDEKVEQLMRLKNKQSLLQSVKCIKPNSWEENAKMRS